MRHFLIKHCHQPPQGYNLKSELVTKPFMFIFQVESFMKHKHYVEMRISEI
jgi:hypothetical protein